MRACIQSHERLRLAAVASHRGPNRTASKKKENSVLSTSRRAASRLLCAVVAVAGALAALPMSGIAASLPDGRAYELVSPPTKNGGDVVSDIGRTRAASSGNAATYGSLQAFADAHGTGIGTLYLSRRDGKPGTNGWATHALFPKLVPLSAEVVPLGQDTTYPGDLSDDLSTGVLRTLTPLTDDPNVANVSNLYLRSDLLTPGEGAYELLTSCPACSAPLTDPFGNSTAGLGGQSTDFGHILFEVRRSLTADAPPQSRNCLNFGFGCRPLLYEWDHGTLRLAGILPNGTAAPISIAGQGVAQRNFTTHMISDDGSRIFFTAPATAAERGGALYLRTDHASTVQVNASERGTPDPSGPLPGFFQTASADGSRVFFTTDEELTDDDANATTDLYMYDASLPDSDPRNLTRISVDSEPPDDGLVAGVIGASLDGSWIYFITQGGQLVAGQPPLAGDRFGIYAWHDGTLAFVGDIADAGGLIDRIALGRNVNLGTVQSRVAPDGRHMLFVARDGAGLTGYDHGTCGDRPCSELYLYSADSDTVTCASCNPSGAPATADALFNVLVGNGGSGGSTHLNHPLTDDGSRVFFETREKLLPQDRNGTKSDVYEYDAATGQVHLLSSGSGPDDAHFLDATPNGHDVFVNTTDRLVGWDVDDNYDLYDARIGGGFPEPPPAGAGECVGDACQGPLLAPAAAAAPRSASFFRGSDNVRRAQHRAAKKCRQGKVRKRIHGKRRCVRKHRARHRARVQRRSK
jgi:hypothetical protein